MTSVLFESMNTTEALLLSEARNKSKSGEAQAIREARGLSRKETGDVVGVAESTIFRWESGDRKPRGDAGIRFGRFLRALDRQGVAP